MMTKKHVMVIRHLYVRIFAILPISHTFSPIIKCYDNYYNATIGEFEKSVRILMYIPAYYARYRIT